jgi:S1-C subfamily serine protease
LNRTVAGALIALACVFAMGAGPMQSNIAEVARRQAAMLNPTVLVEVDGATGSGTFITKRLVLTNYHVVEELETATIRGVIKEGRKVKRITYTGKVVARDPARDLALVEISREWEGPVARLARGDIALASGEDVWIVGSPLGKPTHSTQGHIRVVDDIGPGRKPATSTTAFATWGNSGGGCYRQDRSGRYELIGVLYSGEIVNVGITVVLSNYTYCLTIKSVAAFLAAHGVVA